MPHPTEVVKFISVIRAGGKMSITTVTSATGIVNAFSGNTTASAVTVSTALWLGQWSASPYLSYSDSVSGSSAAYDPVYGNAAYTWETAGTAEQLALYNNPTSLGGGYVYSLTNDNAYTTGGVSNGLEVDMFLQTPADAETVSFNNTINLSFNAKITQNSFQISSVAGATETHDPQYEIGRASCRERV